MIKVYWVCKNCGMRGCSEQLPMICPYCNSKTGTLVDHREPKPTFIECDTVEAANLIDMTEYRLVSYSNTLGKYVFTLRVRK